MKYMEYMKYIKCMIKRSTKKSLLTSKVNKKVSAKKNTQNFTKVANMTNLKLKNNPAAFPRVLKNILKSDRKLGNI